MKGGQEGDEGPCDKEVINGFISLWLCFFFPEHFLDNSTIEKIIIFITISIHRRLHTML